MTSQPLQAEDDPQPVDEGPTLDEQRRSIALNAAIAVLGQGASIDALLDGSKRIEEFLASGKSKSLDHV